MQKSFSLSKIKPNPFRYMDRRLEKLKATTTNLSGRITVQPLEIFSFWTMPGHGSEWASFGLARCAPHSSRIHPA
jgi:hypothetical protein